MPAPGRAAGGGDARPRRGPAGPAPRPPAAPGGLRPPHSLAAGGPHPIPGALTPFPGSPDRRIAAPASLGVRRRAVPGSRVPSRRVQALEGPARLPLGVTCSLDEIRVGASLVIRVRAGDGGASRGCEPCEGSRRISASAFASCALGSVCRGGLPWGFVCNGIGFASPVPAREVTVCSFHHVLCVESSGTCLRDGRLREAAGPHTCPFSLHGF